MTQLEEDDDREEGGDREPSLGSFDRMANQEKAYRGDRNQTVTDPFRFIKINRPAYHTIKNGRLRHLSLYVLCAPFHDPTGVKFFTVRSLHILNYMALAQCACCHEGIVPRGQQSGPFEFRVSLLEITNAPVLGFAHLPSSLTSRSCRARESLAQPSDARKPPARA
jgi:hypothetical protein